MPLVSSKHVWWCSDAAFRLLWRRSSWSAHHPTRRLWGMEVLSIRLSIIEFTSFSYPRSISRKYSVAESSTCHEWLNKQGNCSLRVVSWTPFASVWVHGGSEKQRADETRELNAWVLMRQISDSADSKIRNVRISAGCTGGVLVHTRTEICFNTKCFA